jgi:anti-sigma factor RsiW
MTVSELDLEILETYLDGELPMSEAEGLWRRLAAEPELSAALDELRASRAIRMSTWESAEPTDLETVVLVNRVKSAVRRRRGLEGVRRVLVFATAAAACIAIGFNIGWLAHVPGPSTVPATDQDLTTVAIHDTNGNLLGTQKFNSAPEAHEFVHYLNAQSQEQRDPSQNVVPVSDEQF